MSLRLGVVYAIAALAASVAVAALGEASATACGAECFVCDPEDQHMMETGTGGNPTGNHGCLAPGSCPGVHIECTVEDEDVEDFVSALAVANVPLNAHQVEMLADKN